MQQVLHGLRSKKNEIYRAFGAPLESLCDSFSAFEQLPQKRPTSPQHGCALCLLCSVIAGVFQLLRMCSLQRRHFFR